jgi:RNA-directed DNA polymerase
MSEAKPYCISKWEVWEAYKRVKANQGAAGVDEQTIEDFERDLKGNLYKFGIGCRRAVTFRRRCGR